MSSAISPPVCVGRTKPTISVLTHARFGAGNALSILRRAHGALRPSCRGPRRRRRGGRVRRLAATVAAQRRRPDPAVRRPRAGDRLGDRGHGRAARVLLVPQGRRRAHPRPGGVRDLRAVHPAAAQHGAHGPGRPRAVGGAGGHRLGGVPPRRAARALPRQGRGRDPRLQRGGQHRLGAAAHPRHGLRRRDRGAGRRRRLARPHRRHRPRPRRRGRAACDQPRRRGRAAHRLPPDVRLRARSWW